MGKSREGKVVLTRVDCDLGQCQLSTCTGPLGLAALLCEVNGASDKAQRKVIEAEAIQGGGEIPGVCGLGGIEANRLPVKSEHPVELAFREKALGDLILGSLPRSKYRGEQLVCFAG